ncbi:hypothetical protein GGR56DRAFT_694181, partial [Xylariaceae sp. FL0804]
RGVRIRPHLHVLGPRVEEEGTSSGFRFGGRISLRLVLGLRLRLDRRLERGVQAVELLVRQSVTGVPIYDLRCFLVVSSSDVLLRLLGIATCCLAVASCRGRFGLLLLLGALIRGGGERARGWRHDAARVLRQGFGRQVAPVTGLDRLLVGVERIFGEQLLQNFARAIVDLGFDLLQGGLMRAVVVGH